MFRQPATRNLFYGRIGSEPCQGDGLEWVVHVQDPSWRGLRRDPYDDHHRPAAPQPVLPPPQEEVTGAMQTRDAQWRVEAVRRDQNVAIGLTGLPDVPAKRTGATARWKSHWPSSAAVVAHASRSQLSSSHRPIATRLTA